MIVMKFGGTSVESAEAVERVAEIIASRESQRPVAVVSAMGKTTDRLVELVRMAADGDLRHAETLVASLRTQHLEHGLAVARQDDVPELSKHIGEHFDQLATLVKGFAALGEATPRSMDLVLSFGERLSSAILAAALRARGVDGVWIDSRAVIVTDDRFGGAAPLLDETRDRLRETVAPLAAQGKIPVMGGFIASNRQGVTTTLGRGGSDYSASLIGACLDAAEVQIWTDVDGVMTADPSLVRDAQRLRVMSFAEAAELAYFGARVLHPATMAPAVEKNIPIRVVNSRRPGSEGTLIVADPPARAVVKSIAYKENISVVDVRSTRMLMAHGFLARIFDVFDKYETPVDMVTTSEVSVSLTVDKTDRLGEVIADLRQVADVERRDRRAIVCVVGDGIRHTPGISAKIFTALDGILIEMISLGASRLNVSFVVDEKNLGEVVTRLHESFFSEPDAAVFA